MEWGHSKTAACPAMESGQLSFIKPNHVNESDSIWSVWTTPFWDRIVNQHINITSPIYTYRSYSNIVSVTSEFKNAVSSDNIPEEEFYKFEGRIGIANSDEKGWNEYKTHLLWGYLLPEIVPQGTVVRNFTFDYKHFERLLHISIMGSNWKTGQFRYKNVALKSCTDEDKDRLLNNLIWCRSEMDIANPNLLRRVNFHGGTFNGYTIECTDAPNPYIREKYVPQAAEDAWDGSTMSAHVYDNDVQFDEFIKDSFTFSCYVRLVKEEDVRILVELAKMYIDDNGHIKTDKFHARQVFDVSATEWTRLTLTTPVIRGDEMNRWSVRRYNSVEDINTPAFEICGIKLERGDKMTAWTPLSDEVSVDANRYYVNDVIGAVDTANLVNKRIFMGYNAVVLPFGLNKQAVKNTFGANAKIFHIKEISDSLQFVEEDEIIANQPCILYSETDKTGFTFRNVNFTNDVPVYCGSNYMMTGVYRRNQLYADDSRELYALRTEGRLERLTGMESFYGMNVYFTKTKENLVAETANYENHGNTTAELVELENGIVQVPGVKHMVHFWGEQSDDPVWNGISCDPKQGSIVILNKETGVDNTSETFTASAWARGYVGETNGNKFNFSLIVTVYVDGQPDRYYPRMSEIFESHTDRWKLYTVTYTGQDVIDKIASTYHLDKNTFEKVMIVSQRYYLYGSYDADICACKLEYGDKYTGYID